MKQDFPIQLGCGAREIVEGIERHYRQATARGGLGEDCGRPQRLDESVLTVSRRASVFRYRFDA